MKLFGSGRKNKRGSRFHDLERVVRDLTMLEINTVVCDGMTARSVPSPPYALFDVLDSYAAFVRERAGEQTFDLPLRETLAALELKLDVKTFNRIGTAAKTLEHGWPRDENRLVLVRIRDNCATVCDMFTRLEKSMPSVSGETKEKLVDGGFTRRDLDRLVEDVADDEWPSEERLLVRKLWELKTEKVVMQTVIQLDGDVVCRIQRDRASEDNRSVQLAHHSAVQASFRNWQFMIKALGSIASFATGR